MNANALLQPSNQKAPTVTDYMHRACFEAGDDGSEMFSAGIKGKYRHALARTLEALDTERAAHEATKALAATAFNLAGEAEARAEKAKAELQALREAVQVVLSNFTQSEVQGYHTADRTFAIEILVNALTRKDA
jgi:hypothetical protein